jgi:hypothetical protein
LKHLTEKTLAENINRLFMFISLPYPSVWETWEKAAKAKEMLFFLFFPQSDYESTKCNTNSLSY